MEYQYEVALSFAGENRTFAEAVATALRQEGVEVFYDNFYAADLWGEDLSIKLRDVYYGRSRYCIMLLSDHYLQKMWTSFERQQAIERLVEQKGKSYILPVRLDGFKGEVPGFSNLIGYLTVRSSEPQKVVEQFLQKVGTSFDEIVAGIEGFARDTHEQYPHFEHDLERITTRKALCILYNSGEELTRFKIWLGGGFGEHTLCLLHGRRIDVDSDGSTNEIIYLEEHEGELKFKPMGMPTFGGERDRMMSPQEVAEYIWRIVCQPFSYNNDL
jgi:hypothetical protein